MKMVGIPENERARFEKLILGNAKVFGLTPEDYLRKVWYHEEASKVGEYIAMVFLDQLLPLLSTLATKGEEQKDDSIISEDIAASVP